MEENYNAPPAWLVAVIIIAAGLGFALAWPQLQPVERDAAPWAAAPVPTLQPTPAIAVPPAPAPPAAPPPPAVYVERVEQGGQVVINNNTTTIDVCISLDCD